MKFKVTLELLLRDTYALVEDREGFDDMYFRQDSCVEQDKMDRIEKILEMSSVPTDSTLLALVIHLLADVSNDWLVKDDYGGRPTPLNRALCSLLIDQVAEYLETGR